MFNHSEMEKKWQKYWDEHNTFYTDTRDFSKPKFYALDMFPYPSGVGLHAGHPEGYTATDIVCRMKRMQGYNVLHPKGFDSFGLPAEQYAIQTGNHPAGFTERNIETFTQQLKMLGFSYDWSKQVSTHDPKFYAWTQWIFKQLFEDGLAKCVEMPVNWCEELGTVLANDEIVDGKSERGGYPVVRKNMRQWVIDIVKYAERLLEGLETIDWPESTKEMQRNWIGKSIGAHVNFKVAGHEENFTVFTTRCDTLFGATYCVLAPEHRLIDMITTADCKEAVEAYKAACATKSDLERTELNKDKTGVFTGAYAINPVNGKQIPIWISDYVLASYGTGAIMAVPAHDQRDYDFAKKFGLEIIQVLAGDDISEKAHEEDGLHINSEFLDGLNKQDAIDTMIKWLEDNGCGTKHVNYRLREWIFARQRYWGEPIPVVHLEDGNLVALSDDQLPLILPELEDYSPSGSASPLEKATDWINREVNGVKGKLETSTMPGSAGSSWYFLRYIDPDNTECLADPELLKHWMPVDLYIGGPEHAVGHLLYSRMWNNYLYDKGLVPTKEPFKKRVAHGMILGSNGEKMSKSRGNVINPDDMVRIYGADALRCYELFIGDYEKDAAWSDNGLKGCKRFLDRIERLKDKVVDGEEYSKDLENIIHKTIKKVTNDLSTMKYNTAVSSLMILTNAFEEKDKITKKDYQTLLILLNPIAPHITEELNEELGFKTRIVEMVWPEYDEAKTIDNEVTIGVQVNGKLRGEITIAINSDEDTIKEKALANENVNKHLEGKEIVKIIIIKGKIVNIVVR